MSSALDDLLSHDEMETHNLSVQFAAENYLFYKNHSSQNVRIISNPMHAFLIFSFHVLEHIQNNVSFFASKHVSMYVLHTSIRYFKQHTVPITMINTEN